MARAPLVGEGLAVDQDECGDALGRCSGAGDHRLAGSGWGDENPEIVGQHGVQCRLLLRIEGGSKREVVWRSGFAVVGEREAASGLLDEIAETLEYAAGQDDVPGWCLVEVLQVARCVPG